MGHSLAALLYLIITILFSLNLKALYAKYKDEKISLPTILATASLVVTFLLLSFYFVFAHIALVFIAQVYLISTMLYIKFFSKKK